MTEDNKPDRGRDSRLRRDLLWLSTLGINLVFAGAAGGVLGWFIDRWLKTPPVFTIVLFLIGTFAGFRQIFKEVKKLGNEEDIPHDPQ